MADIFISYSSLDRPKAQALAGALEQAGFSVWWDRKIPTGEAFDEELEKRLDEARAVVVLWSPNSVKSKWVRDEVSEGLAKKALFPVMIEEVRLPFGYRRIQTADFKDWKPGEAHLGLDQLVASLRRLFSGGTGALELQGDVSATPPVRHNWFIDRWRASIAFRLGALAAPAVVMGVGALIMMNLRLPTHVQLDLTVQKIRFTVGGNASTPVLDTLAFSNLSIEKFQSVSLSPRTIRVADADQLDAAADAAKGAQWHSVAMPPAEVVFASKDEALQPVLQIGNVDEDHTGAIGKLDLLMLEPGSEVTLERRGKRRGLLVKVEGQGLTPAAIASGPLRIRTTHVEAAAIASARAMQSAVYDVSTRESSPEIRIQSAPKGLTLKIGTVGEDDIVLMPKGGASVRALSLIDMSLEDKWESTLIQDGRLIYPEHPGIDALVIAKSDMVGLSDLSRFAITQLSLDPKGEGLRLRLDGKAKKVQLRAGEFTRDARLSVLDLYRTSANGAFLVSLVLGVVSATWGLYMALRELRG